MRMLALVVVKIALCMSAPCIWADESSSEAALVHRDEQEASLTVIVNDVPFEFVHIPAGELMVPPSKFRPKATVVSVPDGFYMSRYELTRAQYKAIRSIEHLWPDLRGWDGECYSWQAVTPNVDTIDQEDRVSPVDCISDDHAMQFAKAFSQETKLTCRLPTPDEWEFACRAGTTTKYYSGDKLEDLERVAWHGDSCKAFQPVGRKLPNAFGLYDMLGNVSEICAEAYDPSQKEIDSVWDVDWPGVEPPAYVFVQKGGGISNTNDSFQAEVAWGTGGGILRNPGLRLVVIKD